MLFLRPRRKAGINSHGLADQQNNSPDMAHLTWKCGTCMNRLLLPLTDGLSIAEFWTGYFGRWFCLADQL
jgi:hypothetical protein